VTNAAVLKLVQSYQPRSILDLGCGEGWISNQLDLVKTKYLGLDGASSLIEIAKAKSKARFEVVSFPSIEQGIWKAGEKLQIILSNFALFEEKISNFLRSVSSFLSKDGKIVIQTLHPCFVLSPYQNGWNVEDFKSSGVEFQGTMPWYGRTLAAWLEEFQIAGLQLEKIEEPVVDGEPVSILFVLKSKNS
jgi:2-polyprenyl-3-methyl-5-hydroxy-6-metoxy-1,4-benzoquinol methylase